VVPNEYVPAKIKMAYEAEPVMVMPEDPLFQMDE
jgi:bleomycin hydrolase